MFIWLASNDKGQMGVDLKQRHWKGNDRCIIYDNYERAMIIFFFQCIVVKFVWICIKEVLGWDKIPHSTMIGLRIDVFLGN